MISLLAPAHGGATSINCCASPTPRSPSQLRASAFRGAPVLAFRRVTPQPRLVSSSPRYGRAVTCLSGGKGDAPPNIGSDIQASLWESLKNSMGNFKKRSIDDVLREQIREQKSTGRGGSGGPPRGGGGGDGSGDTEDGGRAGKTNEFLQVVFATLGFMFLYFYLIYGEDMTLLAKDYIKYLFGGRASRRLKRKMKEWKRDWREITVTTAVAWKRFWRWITKEDSGGEEGLAKTSYPKSPTTPTWWHDPERLQQKMMLDKDD